MSPAAALTATVESLWTAYNRSLVSSPLLTKSLTCTAGFGLGDLLAQSLGKAPEFDWERFARMAVYGTVVGGPMGHYWYNFLDARIFPHAPKAAATILAKMALDQLALTPVSTCLFFSAMNVADKRRVDVADIYAEWKQKVPKVRGGCVDFECTSADAI